MTAEAHALIAELDGILAECELVASHLAITGSAPTARGAHGDLLARLDRFKANLARALEPKGEVPDHWETPPTITAIGDTPAAMWAAPADTEPTLVAAEAVADAPTDEPDSTV